MGDASDLHVDGLGCDLNVAKRIRKLIFARNPCKS